MRQFVQDELRLTPWKTSYGRYGTRLGENSRRVIEIPEMCGVLSHGALRYPQRACPFACQQGIFRSRSTSASNIGASRGRRLEQHRCCHHRNESSCCMENEMQELKRFGSEPDLRYSPMEREARCNGKQHHAIEHRHCGSGHYPERDSRERESRYKGKKKYKAPAPPLNGLVDGSSPDSYR